MMPFRKILMLIILLGVSIACVSPGIIYITSTPPDNFPLPATSVAPASVNEMLPPTSSKVILQRLKVTYLGLDGHQLIGSGCPGQDGMGSIENYHFVVSGVDIDRKVQRVLVTGDNSTLTWEWPCKDDWALVAKEARPGSWDVFVAPSLPTQVYTILFFYHDNTFALGMSTTH